MMFDFLMGRTRRWSSVKFSVFPIKAGVTVLFVFHCFPANPPPELLLSLYLSYGTELRDLKSPNRSFIFQSERLALGKAACCASCASIKHRIALNVEINLAKISLVSSCFVNVQTSTHWDPCDTCLTPKGFSFLLFFWQRRCTSPVLWAVSDTACQGQRGVPFWSQSQQRVCTQSKWQTRPNIYCTTLSKADGGSTHPTGGSAVQCGPWKCVRGKL